MSNPKEKPAIELNAGSEPAQAVTVVPSHEEDDAMGLRSMTVGRYEEIRRRLAEGRGVREIARALGCARATVREVMEWTPPLFTASIVPKWKCLATT